MSTLRLNRSQRTLITDRSKIETAIIELMKDFQARSESDIVAKLYADGYDKESCRNKVRAMMMSHQYFKRNEKSGMTYLELKKYFNFKPVSNDGQIATATIGDKIGESLKDALYDQTNPNQQAVAAYHANKAANQQNTESERRLPVGLAAIKDGHLEKPPVVISDKVRKQAIDIKNDSIDQAIWKAMSDYQSYTVTDLKILLADCECFNVSSIGPRVSGLFEEGWFKRQLGENNRTYIYTLKKGIGYPASRKSRRPQQPREETVTTNNQTPSEDQIQDRAGESAPDDVGAMFLQDVLDLRESKREKNASELVFDKFADEIHTAVSAHKVKMEIIHESLAKHGFTDSVSRLNYLYTRKFGKRYTKSKKSTSEE